jgi:ATP-dependent DNA helicase 2 subunit 1
VTSVDGQDILGLNDEAPEDADPEGLDKLADLLTDLAIRNAPKRVQFSIPLKFGGKDGDIEIGVSG